MQERVKTSWKAERKASSTAETCREYLRKKLSTRDFENVVEICTRTAELTFERVKKRQVRKFEEFRKPSTVVIASKKPVWVMNLSKHKLSEAEESILYYRKDPGTPKLQE